MRRLSILLVLGAGPFFATAAGAAHAQRGPLVADRPDFTEAAATVGRGVFQLEFGYTYEYDRPEGSGGGEVWTHSLGEPLLRVGVLAEGLELRLGPQPRVGGRGGRTGRTSPSAASRTSMWGSSWRWPNRTGSGRRWRSCRR